MCGIAGIVRFDDQPIMNRRLEAMLDQVRHRGPDGEGFSRHGRCALVHSRLSIVDPSGGKQPMHLAQCPRCESRRPLHVVFNGEIYNHRDLRRQLEKSGHCFRSGHSDTEVLLFGYREWGTDLPGHLDGMFAFALWDEAERRLVLARDRTGKKPLYLKRHRGELMFASLVATLVAGRPPEESPTVSRGALLTFLRLGYPFGQSMIEGIEQIPPAHWMAVGPDGASTLRRYWQPPPVTATGPPQGPVAALRQVLTSAVSTRLEADVPLGCFLSGGIDSSVIAATAQKLLRDRGGASLRTFSVAMPHIDYDESEYANAIARHIGTDHMLLHAAPTDVVSDLNRLIAVAGEPTADSSLLPTYWLCKATRRRAKVALSGDGGDELFGGYDRYRALALLGRHQWWLRFLPVGLLADANPRSMRTRLRRLVDAARAGSDPARQYQRMIHLFTERQIRDLGFNRSSNNLESACSENGVGPSSLEPLDEEVSALAHWPHELDRLSAAMVWDRTHYLTHELLWKVDRASMAVALEVRSPMLDTAVCELAGRLPPRLLMPGGRPKALLRALAADLGLPPRILNRPKRGFAIPIGYWFRAHMKDALADHLFGGSLDGLGFDRGPIRRYFDEHSRCETDHSHRLFALLQLALWSVWLKKL